MDGEIVAGRPVTAVWADELGGVTFAIGPEPTHELVKTYPTPSPTCWARRNDGPLPPG